MSVCTDCHGSSDVLPAEPFCSDSVIPSSALHSAGLRIPVTAPSRAQRGMKHCHHSLFPIPFSSPPHPTLQSSPTSCRPLDTTPSTPPPCPTTCASSTTCRHKWTSPRPPQPPRSPPQWHLTSRYSHSRPWGWRPGRPPLTRRCRPTRRCCSSGSGSREQSSSNGERR